MQIRLSALFKERFSKLAVRWIASGLALTANLPGVALDGQNEYAVKAAMLWNFTKFVEWPKSALGEKSSPFVFAILGEDPFARSLEGALKGQQVDGHPVSLRKFPSGVPEGRVHVVFVADSARARWKELANFAGNPILLVGETESFAKGSGHIAFVADGRRIAFVINNRSAQAAGLTISSKLLSLAKKVDP